MNRFSQSEWADPQLARAYRDQADDLIQDRPRFFSLLELFYRTFIMDRKEKNILDLGCGDGILGEMLLAMDAEIRLSVWDGSDDMLKAARERLYSWPDVQFQQITFQQVLFRTDLVPAYDLIVSGFAIHHLPHREKKALFAQIHQMLKPHGFFINMDTVLPDHSLYEEYFDEIWRHWLNDRKERFDLDSEILGTPELVKAKAENQFDSVCTQLRFLEEIGFQGVECFYKAGMFAMYGGMK